jgi:hypothetical protein
MNSGKISIESWVGYLASHQSRHAVAMAAGEGAFSLT